MIVQDGYHGLSMDRIAEALEYSKGTIYQHFSCKEEILMALVNQTMERRLELFRRAAAFRGRSRERITAVGAACELFFQLYPDHIHIEHTIRISFNQGKDFRTASTVSRIVRGAMFGGRSGGDPRRGCRGRFAGLRRIRSGPSGVWALVHHVRRILDRSHQPVARQPGNSRAAPGHSRQLHPAPRRRRLEAAELRAGSVATR